MSTTLTPPLFAIAPSAHPPPGLLWRFSVEQYHALADAGILTPQDRVELLEGWLVAKMTKNPGHSFATRLLAEALRGIVTAGYFVDTQEPITLSEESEPEPDVAVIRGSATNFRDRHPGAADLVLVVEIAESSLPHDQGLKKRIYARERIASYWVVNLVDARVEVYTDPSGPADEPDYRARHDFAAADTVPVIIGGVEVGRLVVRDFLP